MCKNICVKYMHKLILQIMISDDIVMHVLQSGYLSEGYRVGRGCRQGDPVSPYLFIFILALLIKLEIVGFKFNSCRYKLTQFADDTTLILGGSVSSLQAALKILKVFHNFLGL